MLILLNTLVESNIPVIAPRGESKRDNPRLPSVKPSRSLIPGMEATQGPNNKLEVENKNPTASAGLNLKKDFIFLIIRIFKFTIFTQQNLLLKLLELTKLINIKNNELDNSYLNLEIKFIIR